MDNLALAINPSFLLLKEWIVTAGLSSVAYQLRIKSPKTGWPECSGTVAGLHWNRWPESAGISGRNGAENAPVRAQGQSPTCSFADRARKPEEFSSSITAGIRPSSSERLTSLRVFCRRLET